MSKFKRLISVFLSLALLASSMFVGGIVASAADLFETTNNYDDANVYYSTVLPEEGSSAQIKTLRKIGEDSEFSGAIADWSATVDPCAVDSSAGYAVHFQAAKGFTNRWPAAALIYNSNDTASYGYYCATANTTYEIRLKYYVAAVPDKQVNLRISQRDIPSVSQSYGSEVASMTMEEYAETYVLNSEVVAITEATNGWKEAVATFTTGSDAAYLNLCATSVTKDAASNVDIWVDDITIAECTNITVHNYDGENDREVPVSNYTTVAELDIPQREGYIFRGVYSDAACETKLDTSAKAVQYPNVYYKWARLNDGEYYAGFESYTSQTNVVSYDSDVASIVSGDTYAGSYAMKTELAAGGITAFELRDKTAFDVKAQTEYTVSFAYKTTSNAELSVGVGNSSNIPATAYAIEGGELTASDSWQTASVTLTLDKGTADGYSIAMLVYSDTAATVYIDDVYVTYPYDDTTVNMPSIEGFTADWYPALKAFNPENEVEPIETIEIWGGKDDVYAPTINADGVYEITNGAELAFIIKNGGEANTTYKLTKDIYLNNVDGVNWSTGVPIGDYVPNSWYNSNETFEGIIDGNGHTVYGLYNNDTRDKKWNMYGVGLIPCVAFDTSVSITNLGIDKAYISYAHGASAFVGCGGSSNSDSSTYTNRAQITIDRCFAGADVYISGNDAGVFRGATRGNDIVISNSYSLATTEGAQFEGLVGGQAWDGSVTIKNTYNANGSFGSGSPAATVTNSYQSVAGYYDTNIVASDNMTGTDALTIADKMPFVNFGGAFVATDSYPVLAVFAGAKELDAEIWDGTVAEAFAGGSGTEEDPYKISNGKELALAITTGGVDEANYNKYYIITSDIYLNNPYGVCWSTRTFADDYTPNSWYDNAENFAGTIDGDGHTIYGLYYYASGAYNTYNGTLGSALIPLVNSGESVSISKLGIDFSYIRHRFCASAFVAGARNVSIDQCYTGAQVTIDGAHAGAFVANPNSSSVTLTNSYSFATITGTNYGLVGSAYHTTLTISNCYNAAGPLISYSHTDPDASWTTIFRLSDSYQTQESGQGGTQSSYSNIVTFTDEANMQGSDVFENTAKMPNLNTNGVFTATTGYPVLSVFVKETNTDTDTDTGADTDTDTDTESGTTTAPPIWDGSSTAPASTATGDSADDPILITSGAELHYVIRTLGGGGKYYKLTNDIYLNDITKINWQTGGVHVNYSANSWFGYWETPAFSGHIDGDNHTIYGLYRFQEKNSPAYYQTSGAGLIPQVAADSQASVTALGIEYAFVENESCVGALFGAALAGSTVTIDGCYVGSEVTVQGCEAAAFIGEVRGATVNLTNSYSLATLDYGEASYGLITQNWFSDKADPATITVKNSYNGNGPIISYVRSATVTLENCFETVKSAAAVTSGVTLLTADNMKGADALTNSGKLKALNAENALFVPTAREFADYNYYTYLPAGTVIDSSLDVRFFDTYFAPIDAENVLYVDKMIRGAYVKFLTEPDVSLVTIPASVADKVHAGSSADILANRADDYYFGIEYEIAQDVISNESTGSVNYIFITDLHYGYGSGMDQVALVNQMKFITKMANENDAIDFICLGGDITQGNSTNDTTEDADGNKVDIVGTGKSKHLNLLKEILTPLLDCQKPVFVLAGNHDDNAYSTFKADKVINNNEWDEAVTQFVVNRSTADEDLIDVAVVQDEDTSNGPSKYYYYDLEAKKTRIICLDAINYPYEYDEATGTFTLKVKNAEASGRAMYYNGYDDWGYSTKQIEWLAEVALTCEDGWDYIFLSHMGIDGSTNTKDITNGKQLRDIITAYQTRSTYSYTDTDLTDGNDSIELVDFTNTNGRILSYQYGHNHAENVFYSEDVDLWQICTSSANPGNYDNVDQTLKTETEAYLDIMFVDRGDIYKHNIGAGTDRRLICNVSYDAGDVNMDSATDICDLVRLQNIINGTANKTTAADVDKNKLLEVKVDPTALRKLLIGAN